MTERAITDGCQCGAVRYGAVGHNDAVLCHCRMCQRAMGGPFGRMVSTIGLAITGTNTWVTGGSLDVPSAAAPAHPLLTAAK